MEKDGFSANDFMTEEAEIKFVKENLFIFV